MSGFNDYGYEPEPTDDPTPEDYAAVVAVAEDDPKKPYKAYAGALVGGVGAFLAWWIADEDPFTLKDAGEALLAALAVAVPGFGLPYAVSNPKRSRDLTGDSSPE